MFEQKLSEFLNHPVFSLAESNGWIPLHDFCVGRSKKLPHTKIQLNEVLSKTKLWLEQIHKPAQKHQRHAVICVTGFLSESADMKDFCWPHLTNYCRARQIPLYVVKWQSMCHDDIYQLALKEADNNDIINIIASSNSLNELISTKNISSAYRFSKGFIQSFKDVFVNTKE
jgi:hypothetical protein